jgi:hypothetical protein
VLFLCTASGASGETLQLRRVRRVAFLLDAFLLDGEIKTLYICSVIRNKDGKVTHIFTNKKTIKKL